MSQEWEGMKVHEERIRVVEEGISFLSRELERVGISCSEAEPRDFAQRVALGFPHAVEAERFLDVVARREDGSRTLYARMLGLLNEQAQLGWRYYATPDDLSVTVYDFTNDGGIITGTNAPPAFLLTITVEFHHSDLPAVLARIGEAATGLYPR